MPSDWFLPGVHKPTLIICFLSGSNPSFALATNLSVSVILTRSIGYGIVTNWESILANISSCQGVQNKYKSG